MPSQRVEFIDRRPEIGLILDAIFAWDTRQALFIRGGGGVGKTSLLDEVNRQLSRKSLELQQPEANRQRYQVFSIDLDDIRLQSPEDISLTIIKQVDTGGFRQYVEEWRVLQQLRQEYSVESSGQKRKVLEAFVKCYTDISYGVRTVVFCDTTDAVKTDSGQEALDYLMCLSRSLNNTVVVFSGQDADELYRLYSQDAESVCTQLLPIEPLSQEACREYLRRKQELLHIVMKPEIEHRILLLARGVPFLIDLAAEWLAREIPLPWLTEETLQPMSKEEAQEKQEEFEIRLVQHIAQLRRPLDRLALALAWVNPVDVKLCAKLLDLSEKQAEEMITDAQSIPFIKTLPGGQIKLHDYMERLVLDYVWPSIEEERKRRDSERAIQYLESKLRNLSRRRDALASDLSDSKAGFSDFAFLTREALERECWQIRIQLLKHTLLIDANQGARSFCKLFDEAAKLQWVLVMDQMMALVMKHYAQLQWDTRSEVGIRYASTLERREEYSAAEDVLNDIIGYEELSPGQRIGALIRRGNVRVRLLQERPIQAGLDDFGEAIQLAHANELHRELGQAELEVGWAYSSIGYWPEANGHFHEALELALAMGDEELAADALNELAYTKFYEDRERAIWLCNEAIRRWMELGHKPGLGRSHSIMGTIHYRGGDYSEALKYFQSSRDIFEPADDPEWISILSSWQGITRCAQAERNLHAPEADELLREAEKLLTYAIDIDVHRERARNFNRLARVYRLQRRYDEAWLQLLKAYDASIEVPDFIYEVASLRDLSSMALELGKYDAYEDLKMKLAKCQTRDILPHYLGYGGALVYIGIMGIYLGDSEFGFRSTADGLKFSAESGSYANHTFTHTLDTLQKYAADLMAPSERMEIGNYLNEYWHREGLSQKYMEATLVFYKITAGAETKP